MSHVNYRVDMLRMAAMAVLVAVCGPRLASAQNAPASLPSADLAKAYAPADRVLLLSIVARAGVPRGLDVFTQQMGASFDFADCPPGAGAAFKKAMAAHLDEQKSQLREDMASGFAPPFTHDELVALDRFYQLTPVLLAPRTDPHDSKSVSATEGAEADALAKSPGVVRYVDSFATAMAPMMEHFGRIATTALHEVCPTKKGLQVESTGLQSVTKDGSPPP